MSDISRSTRRSFSFWVVAPLLEVDGESGAGGWTHEVATSGYVDQWHLSQARWGMPHAWV